MPGFHFTSCSTLPRFALFLRRLAVVAEPVGDQRTATNPVAIDLTGRLLTQRLVRPLGVAGREMLCQAHHQFPS